MGYSLAYLRFSMSGNPADLEQVINLIHTFLDGMPLEDPQHDILIKFHSLFQGFRFDGSSVTSAKRNLVATALYCAAM